MSHPILFVMTRSVNFESRLQYLSIDASNDCGLESYILQLLCLEDNKVEVKV
jgi:hypothetical protein